MRAISPLPVQSAASTKAEETERSPLLLCERRSRKWEPDLEGVLESQGTDRVRDVNRIITVEPVLIMFYISFNASIPVMQQFIYSRYMQPYYAVMPLRDLATDSNSCGVYNQSSETWIWQQHAQAAASRFMVLLAAACVLPALCSTLLLGPYSDKAGRKVAMLPALGGEVMRMVVNAAVIYFELPLWILLIIFFIDGILGSAGGVMMACFSYLADITSRKERTSRMIVLEVCMGLGVTASQFGMGHMIAALGYFWPMVLISSLNIINFIYVLFFLPETLKKDPEAKLFCVKAALKPMMIYVVDDWKQRRWKLQICLIAFTFFCIVELGGNEMTTLYLMNSPLCWPSIMIGYFNGTNFLVKNVGSIIILKLLYRWTGDLGLVFVGCISAIAYEICLGMATTATVAFLAPVAGLSMQIVMPMFRSMSSKLVENDEQGSLFATQGWMMLVGTLLGSFYLNTVYAHSLFLVHGFVYFIAAVTLLVPLVSAVFLFAWSRKEIAETEDFERRKAMVAEYLKRRVSLRAGSFYT